MNLFTSIMQDTTAHVSCPVIIVANKSGEIRKYLAEEVNHAVSLRLEEDRQAINRMIVLAMFLLTVLVADVYAMLPETQNNPNPTVNVIAGIRG